MGIEFTPLPSEPSDITLSTGVPLPLFTRVRRHLRPVRMGSIWIRPAGADTLVISVGEAELMQANGGRSRETGRPVRFYCVTANGIRAPLAASAVIFDLGRGREVKFDSDWPHARGSLRATVNDALAAAGWEKGRGFSLPVVRFSAGNIVDLIVERRRCRGD